MTTTQEINRVKRMKLCKHCIHFSKAKKCRLVKCEDKKNFHHNGATDVLIGGEIKTNLMLKNLEPVSVKKKE